jgi:hypothetical protein
MIPQICYNLRGEKKTKKKSKKNQKKSKEKKSIKAMTLLFYTV